MEGGKAARSRTGGLSGGGLDVVAIVVIGWFFGVDLTLLLNGDSGEAGDSTAPLSDAEAQAGDFVSATLDDAGAIRARFSTAQLGKTYTPATPVFYRDVTAWPCGTASGATGVFYCPGDRKVWPDADT